MVYFLRVSLKGAWEGALKSLFGFKMLRFPNTLEGGQNDLTLKPLQHLRREKVGFAGTPAVQPGHP